MQTSQVLSQVYWPLAGDVDDCWVVSALQAVHCVMPWAHLPTVRGFRQAAGDPDDGDRDGGNVRELVAGITGCFPALEGHLEPFRGASWASLESGLAAGHPVTVATDSSRLPPGVAFGFAGLHQVTVVLRPDGRALLANPLARPHARWEELALDRLRPAIMGYGQLRAGVNGAWGVMLPTEAEAFRLHPLYVPADTAALAAARAEGRAEGKRAAIRAVEAS